MSHANPARAALTNAVNRAIAEGAPRYTERKSTTKITLEGFLVGTIWMPATECWKDLNYDATAQQARTDGKMSLRDHALRATMDRDFQSCTIATGTLVIERKTVVGSRVITRTRRFPLERFPSISDLVHPDPDWFPDFPDDDY